MANFTPAGKFAPGNDIGKKRKDYAHGVRGAIKDKFPPDEIANMLWDAAQAARHYKSARGMVQVLELVLAYSIGKPQQTLDVGVSDNTQLIAMLMQDSGPLLPPRDRVVEIVEGEVADDDVPALTDGADDSGESDDDDA